jgi:hypothetical protein
VLGQPAGFVVETAALSCFDHQLPELIVAQVVELTGWRNFQLLGSSDARDLM